MVQQRARLGLKYSRLWNTMKDAHVFGCRLYWLRPPLPPADEDCPPIQIEEILRSNEVAGIFIGREGVETNKTTAKKRGHFHYKLHGAPGWETGLAVPLNISTNPP
jgi:hypothetical protein